GTNNRRDYALFFRQPVPQGLAEDAVLIAEARAKYDALHYSKKGWQTFFLATLLMPSLLSIFVALVTQMYIPSRLVDPRLPLGAG
ncbi:PAS domain-containing sensor histidine kinase, partial [Neisseria meningitidis]